MRWVMALLALIGGAKLGAGACYLFDMAVERSRYYPAASKQSETERV